MDEYALPDPLPERLPDESGRQYRRRVIPGFAEWDPLDDAWRRYAGRAVRQFARDHGYPDPLPADVHPAVLDVVWDVWSQANPGKAKRLAELSSGLRWVRFDEHGHPFAAVVR